MNYDGHFLHARAHRLRERLWQTHPNVAWMLKRKGGRITRRFAASKSAPCLFAQVARISRGITAAGDTRPAMLLVQVGRWAEADREGRRLGLRLRKLKRLLRVARRD